MKNTTITLIINGNTYQLCASDRTTIDRIQGVDRQQLIDLLEVLVKQETAQKKASLHPVNPAVELNSEPFYRVDSPPVNNPENMSKAEVDALASRLIAEEKSKQKSVPSKQSMYKWVGAIATLIILLILFMSSN